MKAACIHQHGPRAGPTKAGIPAAERNGFKWIETEFESPEPERYIP